MLSDIPEENNQQISRQTEEKQKRQSSILTENQRRISEIIEKQPIIKMDLNKRSLLSAKTVTNVLKSLEKAKLIKSITQAQFKKQKVWVLFNNFEMEEKKQQQSDKADLVNFIRLSKNGVKVSQLKKNAISKEICINNFEKILTNMELQGEIYLLNNAIFTRKTKQIQIPCIECKLRDLCSADGVVNPATCQYLLDW